jgi:hypothetical protein
MPPFSWATDPHIVIQNFEKRRGGPEAGALFAWATVCVQSLHYLDDIDEAHDRSSQVPGGHHPDHVAVAHARWATSTSITALDLCAAGLGRAFCIYNGWREFDLRDLGATKPKDRQAACQRALPELAIQWVQDVLADDDYKKIELARHSLTHSRLPQHFYLVVGGPHRRQELQVEAQKLTVRHIVETSKNVAVRHVSSFIDLLPKL